MTPDRLSEIIAGSFARTRQVSQIGRRKRTPEEVLQLAAIDIAASLRHEIGPPFDFDAFVAAACR